MRFQPVRENPDLDLLDDPPASRLAIVSRWKEARALRRRWPTAAVVGPLRTVRGLDPLVRNLLANPQIRIVIVDGVDLTPNEATTEALRALWSEREPGPAREHARRYLGRDLPGDLVDELIREVVVIFDGVVDLDLCPPDDDRLGGRHVFPPAVPEPTASGPAGDAGQRVVGETLAEVWPLALREILDFGIEVPSKYGLTRELLGLVSVIRDPRATVAEVGGKTPYPLTVDELKEYTRRISTDYAPTDDQYSYGSRMAAQFQPFEDRLARQPDDRGLFLTPWNPTDQEKPGGRPCLVAVQFRRLGGRLHLFATFRSHDLRDGYVHNLAALSAWLVDVADRHGHPVGQLQVVSVSAHLYDRDWNDAREVVKKVKGIRWDARSTWRVEVVVEERRKTNDDPLLPVFEFQRTAFIRATALTPDGSEIVEVFEGASAQVLRARIERSGLLTTAGNALWLGDELARAEEKLSRHG